MILEWRKHSQPQALGFVNLWGFGTGGGTPPITVSTDLVIDMYRIYHIKSALFSLLLLIGVK